MTNLDFIVQIIKDELGTAYRPNIWERGNKLRVYLSIPERDNEFGLYGGTDGWKAYIEFPTPADRQWAHSESTGELVKEYFQVKVWGTGRDEVRCTKDYASHLKQLITDEGYRKDFNHGGNYPKADLETPEPKTVTVTETYSTEDILFGSPTKLKSGDWGAKIQNPEKKVVRGQTIRIKTRSGKTWDAGVLRVVVQGDNYAVVETCKIDEARAIATEGHIESYDPEGSENEELINMSDEQRERVDKLQRTKTKRSQNYISF